jgi:hypothetical protein
MCIENSIDEAKSSEKEYNIASSPWRIDVLEAQRDT